jgi:hypothetical protein
VAAAAKEGEEERGEAGEKGREMAEVVAADPMGTEACNNNPLFLPTFFWIVSRASTLSKQHAMLFLLLESLLPHPPPPKKKKNKNTVVSQKILVCDTTVIIIGEGKITRPIGGGAI